MNDENTDNSNDLSFDLPVIEARDAHLVRKLEFLRETEKLKTVLRRNYILAGLRRENDAEHSWHISLMAVLFHEDAAEAGVDLLRVLKMLLIHDLVEIDAGDTYAFDTTGHADKLERESRAADRIFAILPPPFDTQLRLLWEEFDAGETPDARFALGLDRVQPALQNYLYHGTVWQENDIRPEQVTARFEPLREAIPRLAHVADMVVEDGRQRGFFNER